MCLSLTPKTGTGIWVGTWGEMRDERMRGLRGAQFDENQDTPSMLLLWTDTPPFPSPRINTRVGSTILSPLPTSPPVIESKSLSLKCWQLLPEMKAFLWQYVFFEILKLGIFCLFQHKQTGLTVFIIQKRFPWIRIFGFLLWNSPLYLFPNFSF